MFGRQSKADQAALKQAQAVVDSLVKTQAVIWFDIDGQILEANDNFLNVMGYQSDEIIGKHHRLFVGGAYAASPEYTEFWEKLKRGEFHHGTFERVAKDGESIWIEATYNPLFDDEGRPYKVMKFAVDVTENTAKMTEAESKLKAISNSQAVIEFELDGTIITANENFLNAMGYSLLEVRGKHHSIFIEESYAASNEYKVFWADLGKGRFQANEFMRIDKSGKEVWIQASYNPILSPSGVPVKIVKYATDITQAKLNAADSAGQLDAISRSQAVIEFDLTGTILSANDNFLNTLGYTLDEIKGQHHRMFVDPQEARGEEYQQFWNSLAKGEFKSNEFKRFGKAGNEVWIQASYNPIFDPQGKPYKVVKFATETTQRKSAISLLTAGLANLADGNLAERLPTDIHEDFVILSGSFNSAMVKLEELVQDILDTSVAIAEDTQSIASNASDLATRNEHQAAALEETSAAVEEISATIKSTESNAESATNAAQTASQNAQSGGDIVQDAIEAMQRIELSASNIESIVEVIDEISFQTNLLALNAGVEAARAGEAGSGFAVVASEVRVLAQKTADSARQINELIGNSNEEVTHGSQLVDKSGTALSDIAAGVDTVVTSIADILMATREQSLGINEVTQSVADIDRTVQTTAALAEESSAAATMLADRSKHLKSMVSYFSLSKTTEHKKPEIVASNPTPERTPVAPQPAVQQQAIAVGQSHSPQDEFDDDWTDF